MNKLLALSLLSLVACKVESKSGGGRGGTTSPPAPTGAFPGFDLSGKVLEGTWLFKGNMGARTVWSVAGDKVTMATKGGADETGELRITSPCSAQIWVKKPDGSSEGTTFGFAASGSDLYLGLGNAGVKAGDKVAVCAFDGVYLLADGKCQKGEEDFMNKGSWKWAPADCKLEGTTFTAGDTRLELVGSALVNEQMKASKAEKVADLAAAKAKL